MSDPTAFCQKLRALTHPPPGKKKRARVQSDPGELDPLILHYMPRQECMIHAESIGQLKSFERSTKGQIVNSSKNEKPCSNPVWNRYASHFEDDESWFSRAGLEHTKLSSDLRDPPSTPDFERDDISVAFDVDNSALLLPQSSEHNQKTVVNHDNSGDLVDFPFGENVVPVRPHYCSPPVRDISPPSTPNPTGTRKSSPRSLIPLHLVIRPRDPGPCWTAASWKKLSGGLANEGYSSCYLNSLIQVLRQNDGFHNLLVELSQFASAHKYISDNCRKNNNDSKGGLGSYSIREKTEDNIFEFLYTATLDLWDTEIGPLVDGEVEEYLPVDAEVGRQNQRSQALHLVDLLAAVG